MKKRRAPSISAPVIVQRGLLTYFLRVRDAPRPAPLARPKPSRSRVVGSGTDGVRTPVTLSTSSLPLSLSPWPACAVMTPGPSKIDLTLYVPRKTSSVVRAGLPRGSALLYVHVRLGMAALSVAVTNASAGPVLLLEKLKSAQWLPTPPHV